MRFFVLPFVFVFLGGCAAQPDYQYSSPPGYPPEAKSITVNKDFDETWDELVQHVSKTFFSIDNFEKASGLMIVDFSAQPTGEYVDCGHLSASWMQNYQQRRFDGNYAEYLGTFMNANLNGRANITIKPLSDDRSEVSITAKYVLSYPASQYRQGTTWSFSSTQRDAKQVPAVRGMESRICRATGEFEDRLLSVFE